MSLYSLLNMDSIKAATDMNLTELVGVLMMLFTFIMMAANLLVWQSTRRTIALQVRGNYSVNHQTLVSGHRELFIGLLHQPELFKRFASANDIDAEHWELSIVSAFLINQIFVHYLNFTNGTIDRSYLNGLKQDAQEAPVFPPVLTQSLMAFSAATLPGLALWNGACQKSCK